MRESTWGAYQDAMPGKWLVFHGRGLYGGPRYACREHRGDLVAYLRDHFGTIGFHVWKRPPYPTSLAHSETDHAWFAATRRQGELGLLRAASGRRPGGGGRPRNASGSERRSGLVVFLWLEGTEFAARHAPRRSHRRNALAPTYLRGTAKIRLKRPIARGAGEAACSPR